MNNYERIEQTSLSEMTALLSTDRALRCPKLAFQLTGQITSQQLEQDSQYCHLIECVDENNVQLGYHIFCKE